MAATKIDEPGTRTTGQLAIQVSAARVARTANDRLTIGRLMLITVGIALGLTLLNPVRGEPIATLEDVVLVVDSMLLGATLPGLWFLWSQRHQRRRIGVGGWIVLTAGLGVLTLMPSEIVARMKGESGTFALSCMHYTVSLAMLWMLLAALVAGQLRRRHLGSGWRWSERYGFYLAIAWLPVSLYFLWDTYTQ